MLRLRRTALLGTAAILLQPGLAPAQTQPTDPQEDTAQDAPLEEILVYGRETEGYKADALSLQTKFPAPLKDIPQNILVLSRDLIDDQAAVDVDQLYRSISGVSTFSFSGVTFRGFRQDEVRYDGLLGDPYLGFSVPRVFDIERLEVIKGPSAALFGSGEPGGLLNYVTKSPGRERAGYVRGVKGDAGLWGFSAEASGPVTEDGQLLMRGGASFEDTDTFRFNTNKEDLQIALDTVWLPTDDTRIALKLDYIEQDFQGARLRGVPVDDDGDFLTTIKFNTNEETDFQNLESGVIGVEIDHAVSDDLTLKVAGRVIISEEEQNYHEPRGLREQGGRTIMLREFRDQLRDSEQYTSLAEAAYDFDLGPTEHKFLVGGEWFRRDETGVFKTAINEEQAAGLGLPDNFAVPSLDFFNPVFGNSGPALFDFVRIFDRDIEFDRYSLYAQDQITIQDNLILTLGGRWERFEEDVSTRNDTLGTVVTSDESFSDDALTFRGGLTYKVTPDLSGFFIFSEGFTPQSAGAQEPEAGGPFDPEEGRLFESGVKWEPFGEGLLVQVSGYQIKKLNILVADPTPGAPTGAVSEIGEARSRGVDFDIVGQITPNWNASLNYAFNETKILEGADEIRNAVGTEFANAPDHQLGLWTQYQIPMLQTAVSGGMDYVSERISLSGQRVDPYVIFDVALEQRWKFLTAQLNIRNLFDKTFAESGFIARTGHFPGEPRSIRFELTADF